jgi:hypothetical protein
MATAIDAAVDKFRSGDKENAFGKETAAKRQTL